MKYMGSKRRIAPQIVPIMLKGIRPDQPFIDLFCGGCNLISYVKHPLRVANDINKPLIELHKAVLSGWEPPLWISREEYYHIKDNTWLYDHHLVGYACFCVSYSGIPFSGFAGIVKGVDGGTRNYQDEARRNILAGATDLHGIKFLNTSYDRVDIPDGSVVYADKPYRGTTGYRVAFDHDRFFDWSRERERPIKSKFLFQSIPRRKTLLLFGQLLCAALLTLTACTAVVKTHCPLPKSFLYTTHF